MDIITLLCTCGFNRQTELYKRSLVTEYIISYESIVNHGLVVFRTRTLDKRIHTTINVNTDCRRSLHILNTFNYGLKKCLSPMKLMVVD